MYNLLIIAFIFLAILNVLLTANRINRKTRYKVFCYLFYGLCAIIMGFRNITIGQDTYEYFRIFNELKFHSWSEISQGYLYSIEIPYLYFMKAFSSIGLDYYAFQITVAFIFCAISGYLIYNYSKDPILVSAVFLGCGLYLAAFNITRQLLSGCFISLLIFKLFDRRYYQSAILCIIALALHKTAIVPILIIIILYIVKNNQKILKLSPFIIFGVYFLVNIGLNIFDIITDGIYFNYLDNHKTIQTAGLSKIVWVINTIIAVIIVYSRKFEIHYKIIALLSLFYVLFNAIGLQINYAERIGYYFLLFSCLTYGIFQKNRYSQFYTLSVIACYLILFYISTLSEQYHNYCFFFSQNP